MAFSGYSQYGEEWFARRTFAPSSLTTPTLHLILFNDGTDQLSETSDVSDITTEPAGSSYARQPITLDTDDISLTAAGGSVAAEFSGQFNPRDCTQTVDSWGLLADFKSTIVALDGVSKTHLLSMATLPQSHNLEDYTGNRRLNVTATVSLD